MAYLAGIRRNIYREVHALGVGMSESARDLVAVALPTEQSFTTTGDPAVIQRFGHRSPGAMFVLQDARSGTELNTSIHLLGD